MEKKVRHDNNRILSTVKENNQYCHTIIMSFMTRLAAMTMLINHFKTDSTKTAALENSLVEAFCSALESSSLNPKWQEEGSNG